MSKNKIYCIVGPSGVGKTTVTRYLCEQEGYKDIASLTTRPMREGEVQGVGHYYVTYEEFHKYDMVAYTMFDGNEYGVPKSMVDEADFYVIDIAGVKMLRECYHDKDIVVVYLAITPEEAARRMRMRGDSEEKIAKRLANDAEMFADMDGLAPDYIIDANGDFESVVNALRNIVKQPEA